MHILRLQVKKYISGKNILKLAKSRSRNVEMMHVKPENWEVLYTLHCAFAIWMRKGSIVHALTNWCGSQRS